jgi:hypothetical protein
MKDFFWEVWSERAPYSEVSGRFLGSEPLAHFFSHILPKSTYPAGKYDKENIALITMDEHTLWENYQHKLKDRPEWRAMFEKQAQLRQKYNFK